MQNRFFLIPFLTALFTTAPAWAQSTEVSSLHDRIVALDKALFDAFNSCDLAMWKNYLAVDIEFYQDNDDVTTSRAQLEPSFMDRCGADGRARLQRELVPESVEVHSIQGYGAVQFGTHNFWTMSDGERDELVATPRFVHLWRHKDGAWQITRVISYGH